MLLDRNIFWCRFVTLDFEFFRFMCPKIDLLPNFVYEITFFQKVIINQCLHLLNEFYIWHQHMLRYQRDFISFRYLGQLLQFFEISKINVYLHFIGLYIFRSFTPATPLNKDYYLHYTMYTFIHVQS